MVQCKTIYISLTHSLTPCTRRATGLLPDLYSVLVLLLRIFAVGRFINVSFFLWDVHVQNPDEKAIITYLSSYYQYFAKSQGEQTGRKTIAKVQTALFSFRPWCPKGYNMVASYFYPGFLYPVSWVINYSFALNHKRIRQLSRYNNPCVKLYFITLHIGVEKTFSFLTCRIKTNNGDSFKITYVIRGTASWKSSKGVTDMLFHLIACTLP